LAGTYSQVNLKEKIMAVKKAAPKKSTPPSQPKPTAKKNPVDALRRKPITQPNGETNIGQTYKKNRTYSNTNVVKAVGKMLVDNSAQTYKTRSGQRMITGTYKGKGSK